MEISKLLKNKHDIEKLAQLIGVCAKLGRDVSDYGEASVNTTSGNVYIWLEDHNTTLYIGLGSSDVYAMYICGNCGDEFEMVVSDNTAEDDISEWVETVEYNDGENCKNCYEDENEDE